jgi:hypothetical protein
MLVPEVCSGLLRRQQFRVGSVKTHSRNEATAGWEGGGAEETTTHGDQLELKIWLIVFSPF